MVVYFLPSEAPCRRGLTVNDFGGMVGNPKVGRPQINSALPAEEEIKNNVLSRSWPRFC
jgi:hypothetical protein